MNGISLLSIIPCREEPSHRSQMVSQLLFGERYSVIGEEQEWVQIVSAHDEYTSWIPANQHREFPGAFDFSVNKSVFASVSDGKERFPVTMGCYLPASELRVGNEVFTGESIDEEIPVSFEAGLKLYSGMLLNAPYLWGGRSPLGIDCSGFSQLIFRLLGKSLRRDAWQQAEEGTLVNFVHETQPGDLAFFDNADGRITHVGIILGEGQIVHASGKVRVDRLDHEGIFNPVLGKYTHRLRIIKRYF